MCKVYEWYHVLDVRLKCYAWNDYCRSCFVHVVDEDSNGQVEERESEGNIGNIDSLPYVRYLGSINQPVFLHPSSSWIKLTTRSLGLD